MKKKTHKIARLKSSRNSLSQSRVTDTTLTKIALHYEYLFEWDVNFKDRVITISNDIDSDEFARIDAALTEMETDSRKKITIRINSPGGYVYDALAIVGRIKKSKCQIITEGYGKVMSAATLILAAGNKRKVSELCWFMWHEASYELIEGRHSEHKAVVKQEEREHLQWAKWMAYFTKKSKKFWLTQGIHIDAYFDAKELVKLGVADELF